uniref:Uncharacterized protein n=2 Tax=Avena sativa TaxID=4498 RepID=A0ACD5Z575_AVESA
MKEKPSIRVTILLACLIIAMRGKGVKCIQQGKNNRGVTMNRQVNKTILVEGGDYYDCVDVHLQPAFNHPLLEDHKIQMEPSSIPSSVYTKPPGTYDIPQAQFTFVECPIGTVPVLHNSRRDHTELQTIDEVISKDEQQEEAGIMYLDVLYGTRARIIIYEPKVNTNSKDRSASVIQINGRQKVGRADGIGAGSWVSPSYCGDSFARFHVYWDDDLLNKSCVDHQCPGFVQVNPKFGLGGRIQPVSVYNGPQYIIEVLIFKDPMTKNWWVTYGEQNTPIGYWPREIFHFMRDNSDFAFWGGIVQGPTASSDSPQMGSCHFASEGYGKATCVGYIQIVDNKNHLVTPNDKKAFPSTVQVLIKLSLHNFFLSWTYTSCCKFIMLGCL